MRLLRRTRVVPDANLTSQVKDIVDAINRSNEPKPEPKPLLVVEKPKPVQPGSPEVYWDTLNRLYRKDEWRYAYDDDDPADCIIINDVSITPRKAGPKEPEAKAVYTVRDELEQLVESSMHKCTCVSPMHQCDHCRRVDNITAIYAKLLPVQLEEEYVSLQQLERMVRFNKNVDQQFDMDEKARAAGQEYEDRMKRMMYEDTMLSFSNRWNMH